MTYFLKLLPLAFLIFLSPLAFLSADTVILKDNSTTYENVKTLIQKSQITVTTKEGKTFTLTKSQIRKIKFDPVKWKNEKTASNEELLRVMQESLAYSELLQDEINQTKEEIETMRDEVRKIAGVAEEANENARRSLQLHWKSAGKSLLFPGWGQYSNHSEIKASVFLGLFIFSNITAYYSFGNYVQAKDRYQSDYIIPYVLASSNYGQYLNPMDRYIFINSRYFEGSRGNLRKQSNFHQSALSGIGVIWMLSILDALFSSSNINNIESTNEISYKWKFDFSFEPSIYNAIDKKEEIYNFTMSSRF